MDSKAFSKVQSVALVVVIVFASVGGAVAYLLLSNQAQTTESIKIGLCLDLDMPLGKDAWQGAVLAMEQINAEGGLLGKQIELVGEDSDTESSALDPSVAKNAFNRLMTFHKVDFVIVGGAEAFVIDFVHEHKKIMIGTALASDSLSQRVLDDYDRYKYYFRVLANRTTLNTRFIDVVSYLGDLAGFNKIAYLASDYGGAGEDAATQMRIELENRGFEYVYDEKFPLGTFDFTSYFSSAEAAGAQIMISGIMTQEGVPFVKEWYNRQSPMMVLGMNYVGSNNIKSWELTDGKCENIIGAPGTGYPITSKSLATQNAYFERWGKLPAAPAILTYDALRFILYDAIERAGTIETEAVIKALEATDVETSEYSHFAFTSSHDFLFSKDTGSFKGGFGLTYTFQWQANATRVPIYPKEAMDEAGASLKFPPWSGPWD